MIKNVFARVSFGILLATALFWVWYSMAADYGYAAVSGTYMFQLGDETSILVLSPDHSFRQEVNRQGKVDRAEGSWRRVGEGGIVFSKEFLKLKGQEVRSDGQADGQVTKRCLGLLLSIKLSPLPDGPTFHKKLMR